MKIKSLFLLMTVVLIAFSSCEKCISECALVPPKPKCELVPAKILRYDCDRVIFQLLTTSLIGDSNWEDVQTGQRYSNVVSYYNTCKIAELTNGEKVTLYVELKEPEIDPVIGYCYQCQAISQAPPQKKVDFGAISKSSCDSSGVKGS